MTTPKKSIHKTKQPAPPKAARNRSHARRRVDERPAEERIPKKQGPGEDYLDLLIKGIPLFIQAYQFLTGDLLTPPPPAESTPPSALELRIRAFEMRLKMAEDYMMALAAAFSAPLGGTITKIPVSEQQAWYDAYLAANPPPKRGPITRTPIAPPPPAPTPRHVPEEPFYGPDSFGGEDTPHSPAVQVFPRPMPVPPPPGELRQDVRHPTGEEPLDVAGVIREENGRLGKLVMAGTIKNAIWHESFSSDPRARKLTLRLLCALCNREGEENYALPLECSPEEVRRRMRLAEDVTAKIHQRSINCPGLMSLARVEAES